MFYPNIKLTLYAIIDAFLWFDTINLECPIVSNKESHVIIKFLTQKIVFDLAKIVDPDEMPRDDLFLHCLPKYALGVTSIKRFLT